MWELLLKVNTIQSREVFVDLLMHFRGFFGMAGWETSRKISQGHSISFPEYLQHTARLPDSSPPFPLVNAVLQSNLKFVTISSIKIVAGDFMWASSTFTVF